MSPVGGPVHRIDLGEMAFECSLGLHRQPGQLLCTLSRDIAHCGKICKLWEIPMERHKSCSEVDNCHELTGSIGELILLSLYSVFQSLRVPACDLDLLLNRLCVRVRHAARALPTASMPVAKPWACAAEGAGRGRGRGLLLQTIDKVKLLALPHRNAASAVLKSSDRGRRFEGQQRRRWPRDR